MPIINHHFVTCSDCSEEGYLVGSNGVFLRVSRQGLSCTLPLAMPKYPLQGLFPIEQSIDLEFGMLSIAQMNAIDSYFLNCYPCKAIAWVDIDGNVTFPDLLETSPSSCMPKPSELYARVLVEIHSHGVYSPKFSLKDDVEQTGFRLYGAFSYWTGNPVVHFRVGYYQQFWTILAHAVAELPPNFLDFAGGDIA